MDCVYLAMVDVNACVETITGHLQDKISIITMNNTASFFSNYYFLPTRMKEGGHLFMEGEMGENEE